jgi:membrane protein implicated in regulation of membrane protease activity
LPLVGIDGKACPQEPREGTAATQPYPRGDSFVPQQLDIAPEGFALSNGGKIFTPYWTDHEVPIKPGFGGGTNWPPSSYDPQSGYLYVCAQDRIGVFRADALTEERPPAGERYVAGIFGASGLPTFGVVGVGGLVAFLLGSLFLFDSPGEEVAVARSIVLGAGGGFAGFVLLIGAFVARRRVVPSRLGVEGLIGAIGTARERLAPAGSVLIHGEYWSAETDETIEAGSPVEVTAVDGLRLRVRAARRQP